MTANNDKRIILEGKEFFYYFMRRERRQEKYLQRRQNGIFLSHDTRMKQIIERRQGIWDGLERVRALEEGCVCVSWITQDNFAALFFCCRCEDIICVMIPSFKMKIHGAWLKGKARKIHFSTMEWKTFLKWNRKTFMLLQRTHNCLSTQTIFSDRRWSISKWKSFFKEFLSFE